MPRGRPKKVKEEKPLWPKVEQLRLSAPQAEVNLVIEKLNEIIRALELDHAI